MFEYRVLGLPTGAFSTDDISAFRTVVAPAGQRAEAAAIAANAVLGYGAQFVLITYGGADERASAPKLMTRRRVWWARRVRPVAKMLPLAGTFDATLATLGKATRFNLRYYRKRLLSRMQCEFIGDARGLLSEEELMGLNSRSLNPSSPRLFKLQCRAARELPGGFLVGLRSSEGRWLSLIGGWRQQDVTVLHWQTNAAGYEKDSIGTVMRSFFLQHEIERGARHLVVYGGTTHSMANSFIQEQATDLIVRRSSWKAGVICQACRMYCAAERFVGKTNFLARTIGGDRLEWHAAGEGEQELPPESRITAERWPELDPLTRKN
jgi:hypothetical protein